MSASPLAVTDAAGDPFADDPITDQESLLSFVYASPIGLAQTDLAGRVDLVNPAIAMLLMPLARRGGLDNLFTVLAPVAPGLAARVAAYPHDHGVICDGLRLTLSSSDLPLQVVALRLVKLDAHRLMAALSDITEQVLGERERQVAEDRLLLAMQAARATDWRFDNARQCLHMAAADAAELGLPAVPPEGLPLPDLLAAVHEDDRAELAAGLARVAHDAGPWGCEFRLKVDAGAAEPWLAMHGRAVEAPGRPREVAGVLLDATARRETEALRRRALSLDAENQALRQASRLKSHFVAAMSHELRTPLTSVIGFTELLRGGMVAPGSAQFGECLNQIASSGRHLLGLVNDVLDLAKIEANKLDFRPARVALHALALDVRDGLAPQWQGRQHTLVVAVDPGLGEVVLDPARLRQVLYNLLSNAIKFTPNGGRVTLRAQGLDDEQFELEVSDTGIGIHADDLPRLFVEFQQIESGPGRLHEGTGLGLALTRRLVRAQGGDITVQSTPGEGSTFRVRLPRRGGALA